MSHKTTSSNKKAKNHNKNTEPPKPPKPPTINCDECNSIIDDINLEHYIIDNRDVCNICYHKLIQNTTSNKQFFFPVPPHIPILFNNPPLFNSNPNPNPHKLKIFINPFNTNNKTDNTNKTDKTTKTDKTNKTNKTNKTDKTDNKDKTDKTDKKDNDGRYVIYSNYDNNNNFYSSGHKDDNGGDNDGDDDDDDFGNIFLERLLNNLRNINDNNINNKDKDKDKNKDGDESDENEDELEYEWLGSNISNIDDLIELGKSYHSRKRKRYNLNLKQLSKLVEPLTELKNMIGMQDVKKIVFDQIIYYLQNLDTKNVDMLHTVIVGPPGVGKTQLTHIIAKIYNRLGFLKTDKVICAKRDDLIAEYIGQTAPKTRKVLERALGGVLLLDEIYSLSPTSDRDFAKEAIDMINMYLSEHAHDLVCVVAGYKKPTYEKFFSQNEGLARRFTHHFEIKGYSPEELTLIFKKYLEEQKWQLGTSIEEITPVIKDNMEMFPNFGGDMTTLFSCCKKTHSRRLLNIPTEEELIKTKKKIMLPDIIDAIKLFKDIKEKHSSTEEEYKTKYMHMYC